MAEKVSHFSDGLLFLEAFKSLKGEDNPLKTTIAPVLNQKWQIWYWRRNDKENDNTSDWEDFLQQKSCFSTKDEFWRSYNEVNGYEFGLLSSHFDYCVFKHGIKPMWEDMANREGGRWIIEFPRKKDWKHMSYLDEIWLKVLLAITGNNNTFDDYVEDICGLVLMIRYRLNKIAIWTKNSNNTLVNLKIGELLKSSTGFNGRMYYLSHDSTVKKIVVKKEQKMGFNRSSNKAFI